MLSTSWNLHRKVFASEEPFNFCTIIVSQASIGTAEPSPHLLGNLGISMALHRSRRLTSSDSGYSSTTSSPSQDETKKFYHSDSSERKSGQDPYLQDVKHYKTSLLSTATRSDLTTSIGTELSGIQLSTLDSHALDELALLVSERGVVFLRNQDVMKEKQIRISKHYSKLGAFIIEKEQGQVKAKSTPEDFGEVSTPKQRRRSEWVSDRSYEANPSSFSILKTNESGGNTIWVS